MDPMSLDFEAALDTAEDGPAPDLEAPAEAAEAPEVEAAPEPQYLTMEQAEELWSQREAEILHRVQSQQQPAAQGDPAEDVDWNELNNPLSDAYDPVRFHQARDQYLLAEIDKRLAPILSREQQANQQAGQQYVDQFVENRWQEADGPLTAEAKAGINALIPTYLTEANAKYGETDVAAREALTKATETIQKINRAARQNGAQANIDGLRAVQELAGEPGTGGGAHHVPPAPRTLDELQSKWFPDTN